MRILHTCPVFYPIYGASGSAKVAYEVSKMLSSKGHEVLLFSTDRALSRSFLPSEIIRNYNGVRIFQAHRVLPSIFDKQRIYITSHKSILFLKKAIRNSHIIHIHEYRTLQNVIIHHFARKYGVPYVLQAHGSLPRIMAWRRLKWVYDVLFGYRLLRNASKVIALSRVEAQQYKAMGVPEEKIAIIPNGIDLSEYANLPPKGSFKKKFGINGDEKIVLYLGRIHESKGLGLLADAFSIVCKDINNVRLVVVGPDGYATTFSRRISDLGIREKVLFTGFVEKRDKLAALIDSDVFVTPRFYGFPVTFLEACLAGCPIVTTSNELNWIHNNVGYVVESSSIALAKAISNILRDEGTRERFRNNCKSAIKNFDISTIVSQLEDTYKSVARRKAG